MRYAEHCSFFDARQYLAVYTRLVTASNDHSYLWGKLHVFVVELPSNWSDMEDNPWMKVAISAHSSEYQQVVSKFQATGQFNVSKVSS